MSGGNKVFKDTPIEKIYFTIGEVATMIGINESNIRFWCTELNLSIKRDTKGNRQFTDKDVERFKWIKHLQQVTRLTLKGVKQELNDNVMMGVLETVHHNACVATMEACARHWNLMDSTGTMAPWATYPPHPMINPVKKQ